MSFLSIFSPRGSTGGNTGSSGGGGNKGRKARSGGGGNKASKGGGGSIGKGDLIGGRTGAMSKARPRGGKGVVARPRRDVDGSMPGGWTSPGPKRGTKANPNPRQKAAKRTTGGYAYGAQK